MEYGYYKNVHRYMVTYGLCHSLVATTVCCVKEPRKKKAKSFRSRTFLEGDSQENYGVNCGQVATHLEMVASSPKKRAESELLLCYLLSNTIPFGSKKRSANQSSTIPTKFNGTHKSSLLFLSDINVRF